MGSDNVPKVEIENEAKGEELPCSNIYDISKNLAKVNYINYGGSSKKGAPIKGGQNGEA